MIKFYRFSLTTAFIITLSISCSKKDTATPVIPPCLLTKVTVHEDHGGNFYDYTETYQYNSDNKLTTTTRVQSATGQSATTTITQYTYTSGIISSAIAGTLQATWTSAAESSQELLNHLLPPARSM